MVISLDAVNLRRKRLSIGHVVREIFDSGDELSEAVWDTFTFHDWRSIYQAVDDVGVRERALQTMENLAKTPQEQLTLKHLRNIVAPSPSKDRFCIV